MGMTAIRAEREITRLHCDSETGCHRFLSERQVTGSLDQVLEEQIVGALFRLPDHDLRPVQFEPFLLADIVIQSGAGLRLRTVLCCGHENPQKSLISGGNLAPRMTLRQPVQKAPLCPTYAHDCADRGRTRPR